MIKKPFKESSAAPIPLWDAPNFTIDLAALYDQDYQPKKRPKYIVKDGKLFDPVSGLYIDLELLVYKRNEPSDENFTISLIEIALIKGDYAAVLSMTDNVLARNPNDIGAMCDKARALSLSGRAEEGLSLNTHALTIDPSNSAILHNRAIDYLRLGKPQEALADIEKSLASDKARGKKPFLPSYGVLYDAKWHTGDKAAALDILERALGTKEEGVFVPMQLKVLAGFVFCHSPEEALIKIKKMREEINSAPQHTSAPQTPVPA